MTGAAPDEFVTVAAFVNEWEAQLARAAVEADGIESMLVGNHHAGVNWGHALAMGGIRLRVRQTDAERAQEILRSQIPDKDQPHKPTCPRCGSDNVRLTSLPATMIILCILLVNLPLLFRKPRYRCTTCGHRWTSNERPR